MGKILVTQEILASAHRTGVTVKEAIENHYESEIADKKKSNFRLNGFDGLSMALYDAGLNKNSEIKDFYTTSENELLFPTMVDTRIAETISAQPMLQMIVGSEQIANSRAVSTISIDLNLEKNKKAIAMKDITEGSDFPVVSIRSGDKSITLVKKGVAIESTYEALEFTPVDIFLKTISAVSNHIALAQAEDAINVLVNGDGNDNALTMQTTTSTPDKVNSADILKLALDFYDKTGGMMMDTIICGKDLYIAINSLIMSVNESNKYSADGGSFSFPQSMFKDITVIYNSAVPDSGGKKIAIGINRENAITKYVLSGSSINELATNIRNQTKLGTLSETVGFSKFMKDASIGLKFA